VQLLLNPPQNEFIPLLRSGSSLNTLPNADRIRSAGKSVRIVWYRLRCAPSDIPGSRRDTFLCSKFSAFACCRKLVRG